MSVPSTDLLKERIRFVRVEVFFRNTVGFQAGSIIAAVLSRLVFIRSGASVLGVSIWTASILSVSLCSMLFERYVARVGLSPTNFRRFFAIRVALGCTNATLIGGSLAFLPEQTWGIEYVFVFVVMASVVALV